LQQAANPAEGEVPGGPKTPTVLYKRSMRNVLGEEKPPSF
jgi:hypothetical protein